MLPAAADGRHLAPATHRVWEELAPCWDRETGDAGRDTARTWMLPCVEGLMDMPDLGPLLAALGRLLKPGGRFIFSVINPDHPSLAAMAPGGVAMQVVIPDQPRPHHYFHRPFPQLLQLAKRAGFSLVESAVAGGDYLVVSLRKDAR